MTKRSGEMLNQPSQFSVAFAYDYGADKWLIHDHRVLPGIAVAASPAAPLQADAMKPPSIVPSVATVSVK